MPEPGGRRPPIFGPEPWVEVGGCTWSHWDLWFCIVCVLDAGGDWAEVDEEIRRRLPAYASGRSWEAKRTHLLDLRARLDAAGVPPSALLAQSEMGKPLVAKARRKVLDQELAGRDLTAPMRDTPRRRLRARAWRGWWDGFPVSPAPFADGFGSYFDDDDDDDRDDDEREWHPSIEVAAREAHDELAGDVASQMALWRGILTAGVEGYHWGMRDALGQLGQVLGEALEAYAVLPWRESGIDPTTYWRDLCEWSVWDDWGVSHERQPTLFEGATADDVELVLALLDDLEAELRSHRLDHQAEQAAELAGYVVAGAGAWERAVAVADRLGAESWMPIDAMAVAAVRAGRVELAVEVYRAAVMRGGAHAGHLATRCRELTGKEVPRLRLLPGP